MTTQTDLFNPAEEVVDCIEDDRTPAPATSANAVIAVPCGYRNRYNSPCSRLGNWPVMADGKQMVCRDRPMVHCDPACFKGETPTRTSGMDDDDIVWEDRLGEYGDEQPD